MNRKTSQVLFVNYLTTAEICEIHLLVFVCRSFTSRLLMLTICNFRIDKHGRPSNLSWLYCKVWFQCDARMMLDGKERRTTCVGRKLWFYDITIRSNRRKTWTGHLGQIAKTDCIIKTCNFSWLLGNNGDQRKHAALCDIEGRKFEIEIQLKCQRCPSLLSLEFFKENRLARAQSKSFSPFSILYWSDILTKHN